MNEQEEFWNQQLDNILKNDNSEHEYEYDDENDDVDVIILGIN